ncbi:MAG: hypothetical protein JO271_07435 [Verrucomicrobia bacterium]|nr:hypothetical protein [Verrucomicrobiota bacterium]MBV9274292.1 hypothetical protein [Verrucomicrobiota bacterium]
MRKLIFTIVTAVTGFGALAPAAQAHPYYHCGYHWCGYHYHHCGGHWYWYHGCRVWRPVIIVETVP